ncbi:MAG: FAD-binding oxidoreductase [Alphaproteobacteria bacterium]|nr:FAD-binding oxidoreductase [Alphaproteobacteria bacterium]
MSPPVDPVPSDDALPPSTGVVVIGGGIVGVSTALALAEKGIATVLCEKGVIGGEQSSRNWGWVRIAQRDPREIALCVESLRIWDGLNEKLGEETGFRRAGVFYLVDDPAALAGKEAWLEHARPYQLDMRLVDGADVARLVPAMTRKVAGGIWSPADGRAEPQMAAPAIARGARRLGAKVLTGCAVRGVETTAGKVSAVVTEKGRVACDAVVLAGGAWSRLFAGNAGIDLPQIRVMSSVMRTEPIDGGFAGGIGTPDYGIRKRQDGGYNIARRGNSVYDIVPDTFRQLVRFLPTMKAERNERRLRLGRKFLEEMAVPRRWSLDQVTPFERTRILDPAPLMPGLEEARAIVGRDFPKLAGLRIAQAWGGVIDVTPDVVPVISAVDAHPGFFIATGFSGHGFGIGPGAGRLMADLVAGDRPLVDPHPLRFSRYTDGSRPRPYL